MEIHNPDGSGQRSSKVPSVGLTSRSENYVYRNRHLETECPIVHEGYRQEQNDLHDPPPQWNDSVLESWDPTALRQLSRWLIEGELSG
jgi:hypothetical protein